MSVAVVIPAKNESERIAATIGAARQLPQVSMVVVVDDGSSDDTAQVALAAGAKVIQHHRNQGKGRAMRSGAEYVATQDASAALLFLDADLQATASETAALITAIVAGDADLTIAILPPQLTSGGGHGFVVRLARNGIHQATGWMPTQPLSGMRCLTRAAYDAVQPFAGGWGVETGMTIDALKAGLRVLEVPCPLQHRVSGRGWRAQLHRARQYRDVFWALAIRRVR